MKAREAGTKVSLFRPKIREEAVGSVAEVLRSGWLGMGARTQEFEQAFGARVGARHCVALNNCTSALHLGVRLLDLPPGTEVITTAVTFVATNLAILYEHLKPVFADVDPSTGNIDPESIVSRITPRTGAVMVMHYGGNPCDLDEIYSLVEKNGLAVIEDCAHATGATYKGRPIGSHDSLQAFSFDPTKNLTAGEGGALTFRKPEYEARLRRLRYLGMDRDNYQRFRTAHAAQSWEYTVTEEGFRYHMSDLHAAIGLAQLPYLEEDNRRRREIAARYRAGLAGIPGIMLLRRQEDRESANFMFCVLCETREVLLEKLAAHGVGASVHFRRNDEFPMFTQQDLPHAECFSTRVVSLPMHPGLTDVEVEYTIRLIQEVGSVTQPIILLGTHWLAEELFDLISEIPGYEVTHFAENWDRERCQQRLEDRPIVWVEELAQFASTHLALGALGTTQRRGFIAQAASLGMRFATLAHPTARVSARAGLSEGSFVSAMAVVSTRTQLGPHVFVNRGALLGHHVTVGAYASIQCGANLAGNVTIGEGTYVGMGAVILDKVTVGAHSIVGAGAVVTKDVPDRVQVLGVPAKVMKTDVEGR